jgi:ATP-dependent DNA helicase RecG
MSFSNHQLRELLDRLRSQPDENEVFEFKEAKDNYSFEKLGKYFSALSNEANLTNRNHAWLVFGIRDRDYAIVGSHYRMNRADLDHLKGEIANKTTSRITFIEIYELSEPEGRVVLFQIPAAPRGMPVAFEGHYYARDGAEIGPLNPEEYERIRTQILPEDWSAGIIKDASLDDLAPEAIRKARENYASKFSDKAADVSAWDDLTFLNKAKISIKGKITRTAIVLLGREESEHFINPSEAKIRWVLKDLSNNEKDYEIFNPPLLLAVDKVHARIRNLKYRYLKEGSLFPEEVLKYEPFVIREALNNCIAHQDYRNPFLASAMFNLKMVDTAGGGIKKMFGYQKIRFFPLPEYDFSDDKVKVTIIGKVLDMEFARVLAKNPDLSLNEIMLLDKIQKKIPIPEDSAKHLKDLGLIEGRKPNYFISSALAAETNDVKLKTDYVKQRAFNDEHYRKMILDYIKTYNSATRKEIEALLIDKLSEILDDSQKQNKISYLLATLRQANLIKNVGSDKKPKYVVLESDRL